VNVNLGIWKTLNRVVLVLLAGAGLVALGLWYLPLIKQNERERKEIIRLDTEIQREEETGKQLNAAIQSLNHDPKALERLARERLGYAKPGETVIRFETPATNLPPQP